MTDGAPSARLVASVIAAAGSALVLAFFLFVDLGGTVTGTIHPFSLVAAAFWAGPLWIHARGVRTRTVSLVGGVTLLLTTAVFIVPLFRDTHSTAGIGVVTIPILTYPLAVGLLAIDRLLSGRRTGEPLVRGFARRLLAVGISFVVVLAAISTVVGIVSLFDPVTRDDLVESLVITAVSALATAGGALSIRRLWRVAPAQSPHDGVTP